MRESSLTTIAPDPEAMRSLGASLALALKRVGPAIVIALEGDLGAGKTTLVRGVLNEMGFPGHARSPTYTLMEPYEHRDRSVYHLDLYRLADPQEVEALGVRDLALPGSIFLIEWPDKGAGALPGFDLTVSFMYHGESARKVTFFPHSRLGESVLSDLVLAA